MSDGAWEVDRGSEARVTQQPSSGATLEYLEYRLAWTAYPRILLRTVFRLFIFLVLFGVIAWIAKIWLKANVDGVGANLALLAVVCLALLITIYDIMYFKTLRLQIDREGVWVCQGLFPWSKGVSGARWDQIGDATFQQNFSSWITKSFDITVSHQFTTGQEIALDHVKHGDVAVQSINRMLAVSRQR